MQVARVGLWVVVVAMLSVIGAGLDVRVQTGLASRGAHGTVDHSDQKLVINSNNRYIYAAQQVPEYNVYSLYHFYYLVLP
jgi:hypothetical protein